MNDEIDFTEVTESTYDLEFLELKDPAILDEVNLALINKLNRESRYFGPYRVGRENLVLDRIVFRVDPNDMVTVDMKIEWGRLRTRHLDLWVGPTIKIFLMDDKGVSLDRPWQFEVNQECDDEFRQPQHLETNILGAFDKVDWFRINIGPWKYNLC